MLVAKFNAAYGAEGILFLALAPGAVDTNEGVPRTFFPRKREKGLIRNRIMYTMTDEKLSDA